MNDSAPGVKLPLKVINLYAGPGAGKSTTAAGLFNLMKTLGHSVELVTEFAKDVTYEKNFGTLANQLHILAEQDRRQRRLVGQVEWCITDSPLLLGLAYMTPEYAEWLPHAICGAYRRYDNLSVVVERNPHLHPYQAYGRNQTEEQAAELDATISDILAKEDERPLRVLAGETKTPYDIYHWAIARKGSLP